VQVIQIHCETEDNRALGPDNGAEEQDLRKHDAAEGGGRHPNGSQGTQGTRDLLGSYGMRGPPPSTLGVSKRALGVGAPGAPPNQYEGQLRAHPEKWTAAKWKGVYRFRDGEVKTAERVDEYLKGEFLRTADPKDGYNLNNLTDPDARLVMVFLNPIFHPEKLKRVVAKLASLFLGAMRGKIRVDWASLMEEQVDRMVKNLKKVRKTATPVSTYVGHLYAESGLLGQSEHEEYEKLLRIQQYGGPETDSDTGGSEDSEPSSPPLTRKRGRSVQKVPEPEPAGPSQRSGKESTAARPQQTQPGVSKADSGATATPVLTGNIPNDIYKLCDHIVRRTNQQQAAIEKWDGFLRGILAESGTSDFDELFFPAPRHGEQRHLAASNEGEVQRPGNRQREPSDTD
jgi:hypothetical protein